MEENIDFKDKKIKLLTEEGDDQLKKLRDLHF